MKQILLVLTLLFSVALMAGNLNNNKEKIKNEKIKKTNVLENIGADVSTAAKTENTIILTGLNLKAPVGTVVGTTTYDLQTNTGMGRRVATHPSGRWSYFGWTQGKDYTAGAPNRGTGYSVYDRNVGTFPPPPTSRIEPTTRTGWPTIGFNKGRQFSITHSGSQGMMFTWRPGNNELNDWNEIVVGEQVNDLDGVWVRAATNGSNIYAIIGRLDGSFGGVDGGLNFIKSSDNGDNWESTGALEADYNNSYPSGMTADAYQIDASDEAVCVLYGVGLTPISLYKSTNEGDTWAKTIIQNNSNPTVRNLSDDPNVPNFTVDPFFASDGGNTLIFDSTGKLHVVYSSRIHFNIASNDVDGTYYPLREASTMFYWNEDLAAPVNIGKANLFDGDGDGRLGSAILKAVADGLSEENGLGGFPFYSNMIAHPQLGIDAEDNLYLSYTAMVDGHYAPDSIGFTTRINANDPDTTLYAQFPSQSIPMSDVFMLKSTDGGTTWQGPLNVTNSADTEEAYPSIARNIGDTIMLLYQHDPLPGTFLQIPQSNATVNEIAVVKVLPEDISDAAAPPDSEPMLTVYSTSYILPVNCGIDKDLFLKENSWVLDYPEGLLDSEIKIWEGDGVPDFSIVDTTLIVGIYAEDAAGNKSDTIQVSVQMIADETAPEIVIDNECQEFDVLKDSDWTTPAVRVIDLVEFTNDGVTTIEDSGCDISENLTVDDTVDPTTVGSYTVTYNVTDFSGNSGSLVLNVNVIETDDVGPVVEAINLPEEIGLNQPVNTNAWAFIAKDNVDCTNVTIDVEGVDAVDNETIGDYVITVTATDQSNNTTMETFTVSVVDRDAPEIILNGAYTIMITDPGTCGDDGLFDMNDDPWVVATDEVDGDVTANVVATYNYGSGIDCAVNNQYFITYTVTDAAGNEADAERLVIVDIDTGIEDNPIYDFVNIFPNPTKGMLSIETQNLVVNEITVYNVIGKNVLTLTQNELRATNKIDLNNQPEGIYMVSINTNEGAVTKKITISRK